MDTREQLGTGWHPDSDWEEDVRELRVRVGVAALFLLAVLVVGVIGYKIIEPSAGWIDVIYMTVITLTTVGFSEVIDLTAHPGGRMFTVFLVLTGMGGVFYFVSTSTAFVLEGQLGHVFWRRRMEKKIAQLSGHLIVCGSSGSAMYTAEELRSIRRQLVVICNDPEMREKVRAQLGEVPVLVGDPTSEDVLEKAGVERAAGLVAATMSDKDNLIVTLTARQMNPSIRIVSSVSDLRAERKMRNAGADAVVTPSFIGGMRIASELIRPTVVSFLDVMLRDRDLNLRIEEIRIPEGAPIIGKTLSDLDIGERCGALLLACRLDDERWLYNPPSTQEVREGMILILMGSPDDISTLCSEFGAETVSLPTATPA